jgi:hypothetical protein
MMEWATTPIPKDHGDTMRKSMEISQENRRSTSSTGKQRATFLGNTTILIGPALSFLQQKQPRLVRLRVVCVYWVIMYRIHRIKIRLYMSHDPDCPPPFAFSYQPEGANREETHKKRERDTAAGEGRGGEGGSSNLFCLPLPPRFSSFLKKKCEFLALFA